MPQLSLLRRLLASSPPSEEPLLDEVNSAGTAFRRVLFTRNRRVMASAVDGGATLRVHEAFRDAPPEVLQALGGLFSRSSTRKRSAARALIREFLVESAARPQPSPSRRTPDADRVHILRLREEFDRVNARFFAGGLPAVPLHLSGRMSRRNGHFSPDPLEIVISRRLCAEAAGGEAEQTLRHEMIHLWQHEQGLRIGHGSDFRGWARQLDVHPRATRPVRWRDH